MPVFTHRLIGLGLVVLLTSGCNTTEQSIASGLLGVTTVAGSTPTSELEQIYYLGVFDEREQLPPEFYRIRVRGQASILSNMKFGSGWVPAATVDSLGTTISFQETGIGVNVPENNGSTFLSGRKLVLYGPEGFRRVPESHRLVIVMGASPEHFFSAIDSALGEVAQIQSERVDKDLLNRLVRTQIELRGEHTRLSDLHGQLEGNGDE